MPFSIDERITSSSFYVGDFPLSTVFLKNNADYPWLILVPKVSNIKEINELAPQQRHILMDEISEISSLVKTYFQPEKLNIGALGNIVFQLHIHVIARFQHDKLWPHGIWQEAQTSSPYSEAEKGRLLKDLRGLNAEFGLIKFNQ